MAGRFFKLSKLKAMNKGKVGRYLLYALGEIILVVAGILIALQINNANEQRKQDAELTAILLNIKADLVTDTTVAGRIIPVYEQREKLADSIVAGKFTREGFQTCGLCHALITSYAPFKINDKGYAQLRNFNQTTDSKDTIAVEISQFYNYFIDFVSEVGDRVEADTYTTLENWRDTQPWFSAIMSGSLNDEYLDYISQSEEFKNRVAYHNIIAYKNFLPILRQYKIQATEALAMINSRVGEDLVEDGDE